MEVFSPTFSGHFEFWLSWEGRPGRSGRSLRLPYRHEQASGSGQGGPAQFKITAGTGEDDLVAIVGILNYTAASSIARFETRPVSVAERREWFGQFSAAGPYRLVVARAGDHVRVSPARSATGILRLSGRPLRSASRLMSAAGARAWARRCIARFLTAWLLSRWFMLPWPDSAAERRVGRAERDVPER